MPIRAPAASSNLIDGGVNRKHHADPVAVEIARTQPGRECLAIHARQLAVEQDLQVLRRHRRPLLLRLEQAHRPTLAHHVNRPQRLGSRVVSNADWYKSGASKSEAADREV